MGAKNRPKIARNNEASNVNRPPVYQLSENNHLKQAIFSKLQSLPPGKRLTRRDVNLMCKVTDRDGRRLIENMRQNGIRICSGGGAPGYYLAQSDEEYMQFEREYLSRAYTAIKTAKAMRENNESQIVKLKWR